jgi:tetratricopeptide (TPR) repeat protein
VGDHLIRECFAVLMYDEEEDYADAIRMLTDHLTGNPMNAAAYNNRGLARWEVGEDPELALADFVEAARLAPADPMPNKNRGMLLEKLGNLRGALAAFDAAIIIAPNDAYLRRTRAHAREKNGDLRAAVEDLSRAIAVQPEFAQQYLFRASVYDRLGDTELALRDRATASRLGA